ncbi:MAG: T9SS type A sorting domain-containing protein, partial [Cyclobacteriaceae bacterium]|nr:T9SS type A sorting domain-containing protein [Cyclobacteriaceae bacterium]
PNPIINNAIVEFENKIRDPITLTLFDNLGRIVRTVNKISTNRIEINRDNLNAGLYIVQIQTEGKMIAIGRLIIE